MPSMDDIYREHSKAVYRYLLSLTHNADISEELTQETFYQAVKSIDRYDGSSKITTWLCAIAKNSLTAYRRKHPETDTPSGLQALMEGLNIKWAGFRETLQESGTFYLLIRNYSDAELYSLSIDYYLGGKLLGTCGAINADETPLKKSDEFSFDFVPENFPEGSTAISLSEFSFDLYATDKSGKKVLVRRNVPVSAKYAWCYFFSLTGDFDTGFTLNEG